MAVEIEQVYNHVHVHLCNIGYGIGCMISVTQMIEADKSRQSRGGS